MPPKKTRVPAQLSSNPYISTSFSADNYAGAKMQIHVHFIIH